MDKLPHGKQEIAVPHPPQFSGTQGTPLPGKMSPWLKNGTGKGKGEMLVPMVRSRALAQAWTLVHQGAWSLCGPGV